ncbi:MAG: hypothetical protein EAZ09_04155 [Oscillatoriales cyanobacterium]|nr:MAG: hypothetical protein EAZ18_13985 [Oscillatoriales cyanobacterium]TAH24481.1 MAG: hypothetical protein EAZ09_04155 [Oscillatoriales cyanobacterium]
MPSPLYHSGATGFDISPLLKTRFLSWGNAAKLGDGSAVSLPQIVGTRQCLGLYILGDAATLGHGSAVSLLQNNVANLKQ